MKNTRSKKLLDGIDRKELVDISASLTPQKIEFIKAGGSYAIVFGKKLQSFASETLGKEVCSAFAPSQEISKSGQGLTAVEKIFNKNGLGIASKTLLHAGSDIRVRVGSDIEIRPG